MATVTNCTKCDAQGEIKIGENGQSKEEKKPKIETA